MSSSVALVTGASHGIGKQLCVDLARSGFELSGRVAVNCIRLEVVVWSEGVVATLGDGDYSDFEDPVIMSDAVLWLARQPISYTGNVVEIGELRARGAVRPVTRVGER